MISFNRFLSALQKRFGRHAVPHITEAFIIGQVVVYVLSYGQPQVLANAELVPRLVLAGEAWRLITFLFVPPVTNPIFAFFFWYIFYLMGTALEHEWGTFHYNMFLLIGVIATIAAAFTFPAEVASNAFLQGSVFLAFAFLYPDFELYLFFILPVKIKWLALLAWIIYFYQFTFGDWPTRWLVLASICNFLLFFGSEIYQRAKHGRRRMARQADEVHRKNQPRHTCLVCGITDLSDRKAQFRYCTQCEGQCGYCMDHIEDHEHVKRVDA